MQLVEKTVIKRTHRFFNEIDKLAFLSKNLYNAALYEIRQHFFKTGKYLHRYDIINGFTANKNPDYTALPRKVSQQVVIQVSQAFQSFFEANREYKLNPHRFQGKPKIPKYKDKTKGRARLKFTIQAVSSKHLKQGYISLSGTDIKIKTNVKPEQLNQVEIVRSVNAYVIIAIYTVPDPVMKSQDNNIAAIDLGVCNLAAITYSNNQQPKLISGQPLKSINQFYNKERSRLQSALDKQYPSRKTSNKINRLTQKRNNKVSDYLHKASRHIVNQLVSNDVSKLIIGYSQGWKQEVNIGKRNNQNFVFIPFATLIDMLRYKCQLAGISVEIHEESYTSKCSFLDLEPIQKHEKYVGKRVKRGLFKSASGNKINADVNGSYNIMRKAVPNIFMNGIEAVIVQPSRSNLKR
jgi:putative transposase